MENRYKNTFSGLYFTGHRDRSEYDKAGIIIAPIAYQGTTTYGKGTKNAPIAILKSSLYLEPYDEEAKFSLDKVGVHTLKIQSFPDKTPAKNIVTETQDIVTQILQDKKFPVLIGGEHSISIGSILALSTFYKDLSVLQFDAHTDLDKAYKKQEFSHASMAYKTIELTNKKVRFTQVGVRSLIPEHIKTARKTKTRIFYAHDIKNGKHQIKDITRTLRKNVYITIDVDAFDPSVFPSTGTPEPNGLRWQYIINIIKQVAKDKNIVGLDLVEHIPTKMGNRPHYSDFTAAKLINKTLCLLFKKKD